MGIYFNPDNESFTSDVNSRIYIDKTGLLEELNQLIGTSERCIALSHARRFGKSQAAGMIDAYYSIGSNSKNLFSRFEISQKADFEKHLNKYNVIHIDVSSMLDNYKGDVSQRIWKMVYREIKETLPDLADISEPVSTILQDARQKSGRKFVIILDEWDSVIRNRSHQPELVHSYLQFLHALFKSEESKSYLALAYITGILPVKKVRDESALNNFIEYTMLSAKRLTKYFGFTTDEVKKLCEEYQMEFESVREWYDGYLIDGMHMYNPNSVYRAMVEHSLESYWKNTSSFETINDLITMDMKGLKDDVLAMLKGDKIPVGVSNFKNDLSVISTKDDVLTALIHLGYLGYDSERKMAFIPNYEVASAFQSALSDGSWQEISATISRCNELLWATIDQDADKVADLVELAHDTYASVLKYNDENSLSCAVTMAYFTAPAYYNVLREMPTGKGFADIVMIPRADSKGKPAILVELKWNTDADTALRQIKERRYAGSLSGYSDEILLVGISYDKNSKNKKHNCVIECMKTD